MSNVNQVPEYRGGTEDNLAFRVETKVWVGVIPRAIPSQKFGHFVLGKSFIFADFEFASSEGESSAPSNGLASLLLISRSRVRLSWIISRTLKPKSEKAEFLSSRFQWLYLSRNRCAIADALGRSSGFPRRTPISWGMMIPISERRPSNNLLSKFLRISSQDWS